MNEENTKKLIQSFPKLYATVAHFECGDGWFDLVYKLSFKLESLINQIEYLPEDEDTLPSASRVKQKYASLRFYMTCATDEMNKLIKQSEDASAKICEICGDPGSIRGTGWLFLRCDKCYEGRYDKLD